MNSFRRILVLLFLLFIFAMTTACRRRSPPPPIVVLRTAPSAGTAKPLHGCISSLIYIHNRESVVSPQCTIPPRAALSTTPALLDGVKPKVTANRTDSIITKDLPAEDKSAVYTGKRKRKSKLLRKLTPTFIKSARNRAFLAARITNPSIPYERSNTNYLERNIICPNTPYNKERSISERTLKTLRQPSSHENQKEYTDSAVQYSEPLKSNLDQEDCSTCCGKSPVPDPSCASKTAPLLATTTTSTETALSTEDVLRGCRRYNLLDS